MNWWRRYRRWRRLVPISDPEQAAQIDAFFDMLNLGYVWAEEYDPTTRTWGFYGLLLPTEYEVHSAIKRLRTHSS